MAATRRIFPPSSLDHRPAELIHNLPQTLAQQFTQQHDWSRVSLMPPYSLAGVTHHHVLSFGCICTEYLYSYSLPE